ncbi:MAG TPA: nucleotidyltransferase family protein [Gemmatimonadales bacterium]|nr:nucleotidyltransferase family protein [Gemmatimonadales bacterium]
MGPAAIVLAAGRSERMGRPKALLDFRGQPFIVRILQALEALDVKLRVVVLGPDAPRIRPVLAAHECLIIEPPPPPSPLPGAATTLSREIESLKAALVAVRPLLPQSALAWPVDLPHVRVDTIQRLLEGHARTGAAAVVPTFADRPGQPVLWDQALFDELQVSPLAARNGAGAILEAHGSDVLAVAVDDPAVLDDLNTPQDYERLVRELNRDIF